MSFSSNSTSFVERWGDKVVSSCPSRCATSNNNNNNNNKKKHGDLSRKSPTFFEF
jgi:hypothetical protein